MSDQVTEQTVWPTHCEHCGTALASAVVDFDKSNADRPEMRPGEMAAVDYCPNPDCPSHAATDGGDVDEEPSLPGSLGGDSGGG